MVVSAYWGQHYSGVAAVTTDKAEDIVEEGMVDEETFYVEAVEEVGYGETSSLDGSSSIQETKNLLVWWLCPGIPGVKILHWRLRGVPLRVRIR